MNAVYVTGNSYKAKLFSKMVGIDIPHKKLDLDEIQDIDIKKVAEHKAKQAFEMVKKPVIVEDTRLSFNALGRLPGPFIKWFLEEIGPEGLCRILDNYDDRSAVAGSAIAYFDGENLKVFESDLAGKIANKPKGDSGFGWNVIFYPDGATKTFGEMDDKEFQKYYKKVKPFEKIANYLKSIDNR